MKRSKLPFVVTEYLYSVLHRLPIAESAQPGGFEVSVATSMEIRYGHDGWNIYPGGATGNIGCGVY